MGYNVSRIEISMAGNSELMDVIRNNVDNHHAKISDLLYEKWIEMIRDKRIEKRESAFHLSVVIDLKTAVAEYFESSTWASRWQSTSEEDQNGICSILLMDFLMNLYTLFTANLAQADCPETMPYSRKRKLYVTCKYQSAISKGPNFFRF